MSTELQHLAGQNRYLFTRDGDQVGLTDYVLHGNAIHILHTEVDPTLRGQGLGDEMIRAVLDQIRTETDLRVVAECPFVIDWLEDHPEYHELEERG